MTPPIALPYLVAMQDALDIAVVGGGAAGLAAAIFAAETAPAARIHVIDGAPRLGAKILVSGGGRCNVTHERVTAGDFNGERRFVQRVLRAFDERAASRWIEAMGVPLKTEATGKCFPKSDSARTVLDALLSRCRALNVALRCDHRVRGIVPLDGAFEIRGAEEAIHARRVVMATGGRSLPKSGSDGGGWGIVQSLGHTVTDTHPALVPLVLRADFMHKDLSGVACSAELSTWAAGKRLDRRAGDLLWTHFGVSGPVAMDASRFWVKADADGQRPELRASFFPGETFEAVDRRVVEAAARSPKLTIPTWLAQTLPRRLAAAVAAQAGLAPDLTLAHLDRDRRRALVHALTAMVLPVDRPRGWNYAEVTAGGVPLEEVEVQTMASRRVPGLHLIGEMLDCDGRIGGFNFQWAWATGFLGGRAAARALS